jgi:SPP1 family predicted phage head-tail adaptor
MLAGRQNRRIQVDEPIRTQNETGEDVRTFSEFATIWASIEPVRGREALLAGVNLSQMDTKIRTRWSSAMDQVTTEWRFRYKTTVYDILSVAHLMTRKREIEFICKSGTNEG